MPAIYTPLLFLVAILYCCCHTDTKHPYTIKDFRKPLQTQLTYIVSKGIVGLYDDSLRHMITDKELEQLSRSEHPVLRATAFREMLERKSFDHFKVIMEHLDDTAIIVTNGDERGAWYRSISDDIIHFARWKTEGDKNKTVDAVITKHNYLRAAYSILLSYKPQEKHYAYIKDMATRENTPIGSYGELLNTDRERALYGLAKFKKKEDVEIIKEQLLSQLWGLREISFRLMREFPDPAYLEVFEAYYPRTFYRTICRERRFDNAGDFITSLAGYKIDRSARILDSILNKKPFIDCPADKNSLKETLIYAIWNNPCPAYAKLRKQVEPAIKEYEKIEGLPIEGVPVQADSSEEQIRW